ncbi:hypothetical protein AZI86_08225 [Bdellovibrio bacteriovorus]|uniref:DUF4038 domain-containing protein n=1 Tax=Bdellovibrio bacteriovorus TaxID=959 RepID=A0A150WRK8_BDEBC|nr:DUF4038 domain-containing protein [Bdellovibrio bacteriovorus]KYG66998.1 hypothetical protein AZI86_08225 [Bdellovibrio bacteriovorus]
MRLAGWFFSFLLCSLMSWAHAQSSPYPITISANKRHFVNAQGQPYLMVADTAWSILAELTQSEIIDYLDDRQARGVNTILINLIEHSFTSNTPKWVTRTGISPFSNVNDMSTYNSAYFDFAEWFIQEALERDILVIVTPSYYGAGCSSDGWCTKMRTTGATKLQQYGQYIGAKFASYPNIIWSASGDATPGPSDMLLVNAVMNGIVAGEGSGGVHYHVAHWDRDTSGAEIPGISRLDIDTTYTYEGPENYSRLLARWADNEGVRPHIFFEGEYENEHNSDSLVWRSQIYMPMVTGSTGFIFGNNPIWYFADPGDPQDTFGNGGFPGGWTTAMNSPGIQTLTHARNFFSPIAWHTLSPDVNHTFMTSGYLGSTPENYVQASINSAGTLAVMYYQNHLRNPTFDMSKMAGPVTARWYDPSNGTYTAISGSPFANSGTRQFMPPSLNYEGQTDWVLLLETTPENNDNPIAYVQNSEQAVTANTDSISTPSFVTNPVAGNLMVCAIAYNSTSPVSAVSDTAGNSYTKAVGPVGTSGALAGWGLEIWYKNNLVSGSSFVTTATFPSAFDGYKRISCHEYSGIAASNALDQVIGDSGYGATGSVGPVTTTQDKELLFMAGAVASGSSAAGSGFTQRSTLDNDTIADRIVSTAGDYSATMSPTGDEWQMAFVTFKAAGEAVPPTVAITAPSNSDVVPTSSTVAINVTASDNVGVSNLKIYVNGNLLCTDTTTPYSCNWSVPATAGSFSIQAVAVDAAGNSANHTIAVTSASAIPISYVQNSEQSITANSSSVATPAFSSSLTAGNLMVCAIVYNSNSIQVTSVSDTAGNSYAKAVGPVTSPSGLMADWRAEVWYKENLATGTSVTVSANFGSTFNAYKRISCHEYAGIKTSGALDQSTSAVGTTSIGSVGPITTTQANELLFVAGAVGGGNSMAGSGFTQRSTLDNDTVADRIVSSTGSYSATMSPTGDDWQMILVSFKGL